MATSDPPLAKRLKTDDVTTSSPQSSPIPRSIVTWNCNGFVTRCKYNVPDLHKLLQKTNTPDMICIQEARLKAQSSHCRGEPMASEFNGPVESALNSVFQEYMPYWSLADSRYAGTLTLLHYKFQNDVQVAYSLDSAIDLLLKHYDLTRDKVGGLKSICGASQTNSSSSAEPLKKVAQQKSISSFFKATTTASSSKLSNKRPRTSKQQQHHEEGRFQFFLFADRDIIQTYVPNHGTKMEKWEKRKKWDLEVLEFVQQRQRILDYWAEAKTTDNHHQRALIWCGDMNVAHTYMDGTHWKETTNSDYYEWWTDESKCVIGKPMPKPPEYVGMPSFTPAERTRFISMLKIGKLVDAWRHLHPDPCENWNAPHWTWRGKGSVYGNRGQRLDYFLLSEADMERVESCRILGTGNHKGLFCGSDHCASSLVLKD